MKKNRDFQGPPRRLVQSIIQQKLQQALALQQNGMLSLAKEIYEEILKQRPNNFDALHLLGVIAYRAKNLHKAEELLSRAIKVNPNCAAAYSHRGNALNDLKRFDEALASYDRAIALKPDYAVAYYNRAITLKDLNRLDEAIASYDKAIALDPNDADAYNNRGNTLKDLNCLDEALASYDKAIELNPDYADAYNNRGYVLRDLKRLDEALASYDKALLLKPDFVGTEGIRLHTKMQLCDWSNFDTECAHLTSSVKNKKANTSPFCFLGVSSSPEDQLQCAQLWATEICPPPSKRSIRQGEHYRHDRIRVAYVSADFGEHPVSFLIAEMLECHDNSRFDITGISFGPDDKSELRQRLRASFERFIDVRTFSDDQIANIIRSLEVDILVDLTGFTAESRTGIFAQRPAPIQVNYLGYAGTMGANYFDYILADRFVIPEEKRGCYSEKVVYLPDSFMGNDSKRKISEYMPTRAECGLPETGFVFCSFNRSYKITPRLFDIWMRLLRRLDDSILWLSNTNETAICNLKREAQNRGVNPSRVVFAQQVPLNENYLARHKLADLFLDTLPYNAHTTAADALWTGLPILTCAGATFAGRVAASLLNAIGMPELIKTTPKAYEQMAIHLATHPEELAIIKHKLAVNRLTTPLFDMKRFTKHIETAYTAMHERHQSGSARDHIVVPS